MDDFEAEYGITEEQVRERMEYAIIGAMVIMGATKSHPVTLQAIMAVVREHGLIGMEIEAMKDYARTCAHASLRNGWPEGEDHV